MALQVCTNRQFCSPSAANSVAVTTTSTVAWTNSAWNQLSSATDTVWILTGISHWNNDPEGTGAHTDWEIDIGTGSSGSEVVLATFRLNTVIGGNLNGDQARFMIPIDNLNGRHAARIRTSATRTVTWNIGITYFKNPVSGTLLISRNPTKVYPAAANAISVVASGTPFLNSAWAQLVAATTSAIVLTHSIADMHQAGAVGEIDIGIGAAGFEVVIATFRLDDSNSLGTNGGIHEFPNPIDKIPSGSRIAFRQRCSIASVTTYCALMYQEKPL